jgi:flagellar biosynthesis/type III secretory pathway chaperone
MHADFRKLVDLLLAQTDICRDMLRMMEVERRALLNLQTASMEALAAEKESHLQRMQAVERKRLEWVGRLAEELGCEAGELTLTRLAQAAPPDVAAALAGCGVELSGLLDRLRAEYRRSAMLFGHTVEFRRSFHKILKGFAASGPIYRPGGRMEAARLSGTLLSNEM